MLWEAKDKTRKAVELANEKILEIPDGWYIDSVIYPDNTNGKDINSLTLTIRRDTKERRSCKTCIYCKEWPSIICEQCCRNWEDNWEEG